jgi:hypothetical protein
MTANEMADKIELLLNLKDAEFSYEDSELSVILTSSQILFVKEFFDRDSNFKKKGFEETEARAWGFAPLIKPATLPVSSDQSAAFTNGIYYDLPSDCWFILTDTPTSNKTYCNSEEFIKPLVSVVAHDEYKPLLRNVYKQPYFNGDDALVWRMYDTGRRVQLLTNGQFAITNYSIKYLQSIPNIVVDRDTPANQVNCVLESQTKEVHESIVEIAVRLIRKSNGDQEVPTLGIEQLT